MNDSERKRQRLVALFLLGCLAFNYPLLALFNVGATVLGVPLLYGYIFFCWALVILFIALVVEAPDGPES